MKPRFLERSAAEWNLAPRAARWIFWLPLALTAALLATPLIHGALGGDGRWLMQRGFEVLMREDGPVEWAQVACFAAGCLAAGACARRLLGSSRPWQGGLCAVVALGLFVIVGEELSWGQRIFGLLTPGWLSDVNYQDELNAHNIAGVRELLDYPRVLLSLWGVFGGLALRWLVRRRFFAQASIPLAAPLCLVPAFGVMLGYDLLRASLWRQPGFYLKLLRYGEWPELCLSFALGAFLMLTYRRLGRTEQRPLLLVPAVERRRMDEAV